MSVTIVCFLKQMHGNCPAAQNYGNGDSIIKEVQFIELLIFFENFHLQQVLIFEGNRPLVFHVVDQSFYTLEFLDIGHVNSTNEKTSKNIGNRLGY